MALPGQGEADPGLAAEEVPRASVLHGLLVEGRDVRIGRADRQVGDAVRVEVPHGERRAVVRAPPLTQHAPCVTGEKV